MGRVPPAVPDRYTRPLSCTTAPAMLAPASETTCWSNVPRSMPNFSIRSIDVEVTSHAGRQHCLIVILAQFRLLLPGGCPSTVSRVGQSWQGGSRTASVTLPQPGPAPSRSSHRIPHLRHYRKRRPLHNRHSRTESPRIIVITAQAGIQGWGPQLGNLRISTTSASQKGSCAKVSERGYPSPTGSATMTPEAVRHAGRPNQVGNLGPAAGLRVQYTCATLPACNTLRAHSPSPSQYNRLGTRRVIPCYGAPPQIGRTVHRVSHLPARCSTRQIQTERMVQFLAKKAAGGLDALSWPFASSSLISS